MTAGIFVRTFGIGLSLCAGSLGTAVIGTVPETRPAAARGEAAGQSSSVDSAVGYEDPRLDQSVSGEFADLPLHEFLHVLGEKTGVGFRTDAPAPTAKVPEWFVRLAEHDETVARAVAGNQAAQGMLVTAILKDDSLRKVMGAMAALLSAEGAKWRWEQHRFLSTPQTPDPAPVYWLTAPSGGSTVAAWEEQYFRHKFDTLARLAKSDPKAAEKILAEEPWARGQFDLAGEKQGPSTLGPAVFDRLTEEQQSRLFGGERMVWIPALQLSSELRELAFQFVDRQFHGTPGLEDALSKMQKVGVLINRDGGAFYTHRLVVVVETEGGGWFGTTSPLSGDHLTKTFDYARKAWRDGWSAPDDLESEPDTPWPGVEPYEVLSTSKTRVTQFDYLKQLSDWSGRSVFAFSRRGVKSGSSLNLPNGWYGANLQGALDALAGRSRGLQWKTHGDIVLFASDEWWVPEIPLSWRSMYDIVRALPEDLRVLVPDDVLEEFELPIPSRAEGSPAPR